jgi:Cu2+-exporting ATPase
VSIANTLEAASSSHPVAQALAMEVRGTEHKLAENLEYSVGGGICGTIQGKRYCLGSPRFIGEKFSTAWDLEQPLRATDGPPGTSSILAGDQGVLACFIFSDRLRPGAKELIGELNRADVAVSILSGDRRPAVEHVAKSLGIQDYHAQMSPQEKLDRLSHYQKGGQLVLAVGDGVNDAPLLSAAAVSVAMGSGADLARVTGDAVLVNSRLTDLNMLIDQARRTRVVIMQNFGWAIGYNLLALPLGILGLVPPWAAVIGMSLSSLVVVSNALRLSRSGAASAADGEKPTDMAFA